MTTTKRAPKVKAPKVAKADPTPHEALIGMAVAKAAEAAAKTARGHIPHGVHAVDVTVRVTGTLTQGLPFEQRFPQKACPWSLLKVAMDAATKATASVEAAAVILEAAGVSGDLVRETFRAIGEAHAELALDRLVVAGATAALTGVAPDTKALKSAAVEAAARIGQETVTPVAGQVTHKLTLTVVEAVGPIHQGETVDIPEGGAA